jgi:ADP-ribose pyrophosphatase YjhB (NUDIX family)
VAFPRIPALTVDCVVIDAERRLLLIRRGNPPFKGRYALPGGFVDVGETVEDACRRELMEETGVKAGRLELVGVYSDPKRIRAGIRARSPSWPAWRGRHRGPATTPRPQNGSRAGRSWTWRSIMPRSSETRGACCAAGVRRCLNLRVRHHGATAPRRITWHLPHRSVA